MSSWKKVVLSTFTDSRGELNTIEEGTNLPFLVKRIYFIKNVPNRAVRGEHAHRTLEQVIFAIAGRFDIELDDGTRQEKVRMCVSGNGLYIGPMVYRTLSNFSLDAKCLVLASACYDERDYIHSHHDFLWALSQKS